MLGDLKELFLPEEVLNEVASLNAETVGELASTFRRNSAVFGSRCALVALDTMKNHHPGHIFQYVQELTRGEWKQVLRLNRVRGRILMHTRMESRRRGVFAIDAHERTTGGMRPERVPTRESVQTVEGRRCIIDIMWQGGRTDRFYWCKRPPRFCVNIARRLRYRLRDRIEAARREKREEEERKKPLETIRVEERDDDRSTRTRSTKGVVMGRTGEGLDTDVDEVEDEDSACAHRPSCDDEENRNRMPTYSGSTSSTSSTSAYRGESGGLSPSSFSSSASSSSTFFSAENIGGGEEFPFDRPRAGQNDKKGGCRSNFHRSRRRNDNDAEGEENQSPPGGVEGLGGTDYSFCSSSFSSTKTFYNYSSSSSGAKKASSSFSSSSSSSTKTKTSGTSTSSSSSCPSTRRTETDPSSWSHYEVLGVEEDASPHTIRRAYRRRALETHPDKNMAGQGSSKELGDDEAMFHRVAAAYETLSNANKRIIYNATLRRKRMLIQQTTSAPVVVPPKFTKRTPAGAASAAAGGSAHASTRNSAPGSRSATSSSKVASKARKKEDRASTSKLNGTGSSGTSPEKAAKSSEERKVPTENTGYTKDPAKRDPKKMNDDSSVHKGANHERKATSNNYSTTSPSTSSSSAFSKTPASGNAAPVTRGDFPTGSFRKTPTREDDVNQHHKGTSKDEDTDRSTSTASSTTKGEKKEKQENSSRSSCKNSPCSREKQRQESVSQEKDEDDKKSTMEAPETRHPNYPRDIDTRGQIPSQPETDTDMETEETRVDERGLKVCVRAPGWRLVRHCITDFIDDVHAALETAIEFLTAPPCDLRNDLFPPCEDAALEFCIPDEPQKFL
ncbi:unnamed protein product [Amoebophrya sp. A25]|nr:unnamed protein product [Amoebophrya sp. A25]|eukprot:GSA25T00024326001.1